jgi:hypothetical protein
MQRAAFGHASQHLSSGLSEILQGPALYFILHYVAYKIQRGQSNSDHNIWAPTAVAVEVREALS